MNIMIVDDEALAVRSLETQLQKIFPDSATMFSCQSADGALDLARKTPIDLAFVDMDLPQMNGIELIGKLKELQRDTDFVIVTAYAEYSLQAWKTHASDYLMKPVNETDIREALQNLRRPLRTENRPDPERIRVQCFGNFEVFHREKRMHFDRSRAKELFAYLVSRRGAAVTTGELCSVLWEDDTNLITKKAYIRTYYATLKKEFEAVGHGDVLVHSRNSYAVNIGSIDCDYYQYLKGDPKAAYLYQSEFMSQYSWAETMIYDIDTQKR